MKERVVYIEDHKNKELVSKLEKKV